ncbi:MAG TPA: type II toxin-antitoxin system HicB family antitoxin [Nitrospiraceae bacterium]|nr:type II toxin-antitoxin system HicB family antitoxin [Nitrospiraceae bacterium]
MIDLKYRLIIEATEDPNFFGFYSPDLQGFTGVGHSIEDCLYKAKWGIDEHIEVPKEHGLAIPSPNPNPTVLIQNERRLNPSPVKEKTIAYSKGLIDDYGTAPVSACSSKDNDSSL